MVKAKTRKSSQSPGMAAKPESPLSAVTRASSALAIASVRLTAFSAATSYRSGRRLPERVRPTIGFTKPVFESAGRSLVVSSTFLCRLIADDGSSSDPVVDLRATAEMTYTRKAGMELSDTDVAAFATINGPFNAWPYWREFTQSSLSRLGLPVFALPLFRVADAQRLIIADSEVR
jgi:hypothetical protein